MELRENNKKCFEYTTNRNGWDGYDLKHEINKVKKNWAEYFPPFNFISTVPIVGVTLVSVRCNHKKFVTEFQYLFSTHFRTHVDGIAPRDTKLTKWLFFFDLNYNIYSWILFAFINYIQSTRILIWDRMKSFSTWVQTTCDAWCSMSKRRAVQTCQTI